MPARTWGCRLGNKTMAAIGHVGDSPALWRAVHIHDESSTFP